MPLPVRYSLTMNPEYGAHIENAAIVACDLAATLKHQIDLAFNGHLIKVCPETLPADVVEDYDRYCEAAKRRKEGHNG